jgi:hypothetical protein
MDSWGFGRIADMERIHAEWEKMKADCANYPVDTAAHILRPVAAFELYRMLSKTSAV